MKEEPSCHVGMIASRRLLTVSAFWGDNSPTGKTEGVCHRIPRIFSGTILYVPIKMNFDNVKKQRLANFASRLIIGCEY